MNFQVRHLKITKSDSISEGTYILSKARLLTKSRMPYVTLIIGPNGTGKSRMLRIISDIFNDLRRHQTFDKRRFSFNGNYELKYTLDFDNFQITKKESEIYILKNDEIVDNLEILELPSKLIVAAFSIYDRFAPSNISFSSSLKINQSTSFYNYLGLKTEKNYAFSGSYINRAIDLITEAVSEDGFKRDIKYVFDVLKFDPSLEIVYSIYRIKKFVTGKLTVSKMKRLVNSKESRTLGFVYNILNRVVTLPDKEIKDIVDSLNGVYEFAQKNGISVTIDFSGNYSLRKFNKIYKHISILRKYNLINIESVFVSKSTIKKNDTLLYDLKSMSSGEIQILTSMLALSSVVKNNSLVLVDEPEISLHPNWQMKYIEILYRIFRRQTNCHFIIATHSHFLASDLDSDASSILSLKQDSDSNTKARLIEYETEGWSAENILYNIFDVATVRNIYFEMDIKKLI